MTAHASAETGTVAVRLAANEISWWSGRTRYRIGGKLRTHRLFVVVLLTADTRRRLLGVSPRVGHRRVGLHHCGVGTILSTNTSSSSDIISFVLVPLIYLFTAYKRFTKYTLTYKAPKTDMKICYTS